MTDAWSCNHFGLCNPEDDGADDLPRLLRRIADEIERRGISPMQLLDLTVSQQMTGNGPWWSVTLYWSPDEGDAHAAT